MRKRKNGGEEKRLKKGDKRKNSDKRIN